MRWFKHMSDLSRDEGVCRYLDRASDRLIAYGFLIRVLEIVAEKMTPICGLENCTVEYSVREWARILDCHSNRVDKFLPLLEVIPWVHVVFDASLYRVSIPKMLKWRDEYTRKSGHTPDKVAQSRVEQSRTEKKESRDDDSLSEGLSRREASRTVPHDFEITPDLRQWAAKTHPSVDVEKETAKFRRYEFPTPRSNWDNAWKTWVQRAAEYGEMNGATTETDELLNLGALMNVQKRQDESNSEYCTRVKEINQRRLDSLDS